MSSLFVYKTKYKRKRLELPPLAVGRPDHMGVRCLPSTGKGTFTVGVSVHEGNHPLIAAVDSLSLSVVRLTVPRWSRSATTWLCS